VITVLSGASAGAARPSLIEAPAGRLRTMIRSRADRPGRDFRAGPGLVGGRRHREPGPGHRTPPSAGGTPPRPVVMAGRGGPPHRWPAGIDQLRSSVPDHDAGICQPADTIAVGLPIPQAPASAPGGARERPRGIAVGSFCRAALRGTRPRAIRDGLRQPRSRPPGRPSDCRSGNDRVSPGCPVGSEFRLRP
jgi:hypothetical protein